jgi:uncharacterized membrane protein YcaP (DUF421 family)
MFFEGWGGIEHILLIAGVGYVAIVLYIRVLGKRVLSKFDAFDFIITVSLGSAFAGLVTSKESTVSDAVVALGALVMLQWVAGWVSKVIPGMQHLIRSDPSLLFYRGTFLKEVMEREHVNKEEILAGMRMAGFSSIDDVEAVIMERDGSLSAIPRTVKSPSVLQDVEPIYKNAGNEKAA